MKRATVLFIMAIGTMDPLPVFAAGIITGLTAGPNPAQVSQDVTFTVKGTGGGCGDLTIDFGDGQTTSLAPVSFNNNTNTTATHKYAAAKTYAATATPGKSCSGTASVTVTVGGGGTGGTGGTGGSGGGMVRTYRPGLRDLITQLPLIEDMFRDSQVTPGGSVLVKGRYFGEQPGQFRLKLSNGLLTNLGQLSWKSDAVSGVIDPGITGVPDLDAKLQLVHANGREGNEWPVAFTAKREVKMLPMADIQGTCETNSDVNECNEGQPYWGPVSIMGFHMCTNIVDSIFTCDDAGVDRYSTTLANGWKIQSIVMSVGQGKAENPPHVALGGPGPVKISIWWDTQVKAVSYSAHVYVEGPVGTSWK